MNITNDRSARVCLSPYAFLFAVGFLLAAVLLCCPPGLAAEDSFASLRRQLKQDGFDPGRIDAYYDNHHLRFEKETVARYFHHSEARLDYGQFVTPASISRARKYIEKHHQWMQRAESEFQVEKEIIAAIILVETRLGRVTGRAVTFNTLSSMAALADPAVRESFWRSIADESGLTRTEYRQKADSKSAWAYKELKAFLVYLDREGIDDPLAISGSYAGAIGIPQFMPSNVLALGEDGDLDGRVDLFTHADAILSVARYLHYHGWRPGIGGDVARRVLRSYNNSGYYVDTLLTIRQRLKE